MITLTNIKVAAGEEFIEQVAAADDDAGEEALHVFAGFGGCPGGSYSLRSP